MTTDNTLSRALHDLSEGPGPDGIADKALWRAKKRRIGGYALSAAAAAFAAAAIIAAPFLLTAGKGDGQGVQFAAAAPSPSATNTSVDPCDAAPTEPGVKKVIPQNRPGYVNAVIDRLPPRSDYVMQSGVMGMCEGRAYSVINLGEMREAGHLTVRLTTGAGEGVPVDCSKVKAAETNPEAPSPPHPFKVLFCVEGGDFKLVYGIDDGYNNYRVSAIYADGRSVSMESLSAGGDAPPTITAEQLRIIVTDPAMLAFFG
jgi:hypothetical protein